MMHSNSKELNTNSQENKMNELINILKNNSVTHTISSNGAINVPGNLDLEGESITNTTHRKNCGYSSRTIFAAWLGGTFKIAAGCFLGTIEEFEAAVDRKYSGDAAITYKQHARDCINELAIKLNRL